jgi:hypothetical protein
MNRSKQRAGMGQKAIVVLLVGLALASVHPAEAQQAKKVPRIGVLWPFLPTVGPPLAEAFRQGLRDLGYVEGQNIAIEYRYSEGKDSRLPDLAGELVRLRWMSSLRRLPQRRWPLRMRQARSRSLQRQLPTLLVQGLPLAWRDRAGTSPG